LQHGAVLYKQPVTGSIACWLPLHLFLNLFVGTINENMSGPTASNFSPNKQSYFFHELLYIRKEILCTKPFQQHYG
jgi:hypothetical protein